MVLPDTQSILCPIVVGRDTVMAHLDAAVDGVSRGCGQVVLLLGEAGIGKSRLAAETRARAVLRNYTIFKGRCFAEERAIPFAPLLDLFHARYPTGHLQDLAQDVGPAASSLVMLLPELRAVVPGPSQLAPLDPEQQQYRLFHGLTSFFIGCAMTQPVLLILEDLHWSDETTLRFVLYLARRITPHAILLLLSCRADEPQPGLEHLFGALQRERLAVAHELTRLTPAELDAMLQAIFARDRPTRADFLDALYAHTDGNPFVVEEVLKALVAAGDIFQIGQTWDRKPLAAMRIPRTIEESVRQRMGQLNTTARETLSMAAVVGRRFDLVLLAALTQHEERALLDHLKAAMAVQLIVEESAERFAFRHALTRQAVYRQLLARERQVLHRRVAEALACRFADTTNPPLGEVAHHFRQAEAWNQTFAYAQRAGEQALAMHAPRAASEHFTHALEAGAALGIAVDPELYRLRASAHETLGHFEAARVDQEAALTGAQRDGNRHGEWQSLLDLGFLWSGRDLQRAGDYFEQATTCAKMIGEPAIIAQSLNRLGNWCFNRGALLDAQRHHEAALALFETAHHWRGVAETLDLLGLVTAHTMSEDRSQRYFERAIALFEQLGDRRGLASVLAMTAQMGYGAGDDPSLPAQRAQRAAHLAREIDWRAGEAFALATLAVCYTARGGFTEALDAAHKALAVAEEIEHHMWMSMAHIALALVYRELLALPLARHHAESAADLGRHVRGQYWTRITATICAEISLLSDDTHTAETILKGAFGPAPAGHSLPERTCVVLQSDLALRTGDPALALALLAPLLAAGTVSGPDLHNDAWQIRAAALAALDRVDEAATLLEAQRIIATREDKRPRLWRILCTLGRLYAALGRATDATQAYLDARVLIEALAAATPNMSVYGRAMGTLRAHFLETATSNLPRSRPLTPRRAAKQAYGGLTEREREVATHIARGQSNREIAEALVIGPRTVQTHISNIFAKLQCDSRAQVAAWAVASGLLATP